MSFKSVAVVLCVCCFILAVDILSKAYTFCCISPLVLTSSYPYGGIGVFHDFLGIDFSLNYVMNKGAAWGFFSSFQDYLLYARLMIIVGMLTYLIAAKMAFFKRISFFLIITGAMGNVLDYFIYGHVIDMFYFKLWGYSYPVFNVADSSIFLGICGLFFYSYRLKKKPIKILPIKT
ncbi:MAG: signal peptidase II [Chlamydiae bacterium]|nr:signal peptidase II [Chlamydiota bacterium]